jgi:hypothetical protein
MIYERASMLRYTYIAPLVVYFIFFCQRCTFSILRIRTEFLKVSETAGGRNEIFEHRYVLLCT